MCKWNIEMSWCAGQNHHKLWHCPSPTFIFNRIFRSEKEQVKMELGTLMRTQQMLDQNVIASKATHDDLVTKDQQLDKQFRTVFMDIVSPTIIDQAYRIFK